MNNDAITSPAFHPLYQQIKILITQSLISGEWRPGDAIPSETELASRYHVSQGTVRKAVSELADENLLIRHQGKGTFVASHTEERRQFHFVRVTSDKGGIIYPEGELLECRRGKADNSISKLLEINNGASLVIIKRLLNVAAKPVMLEEIRLPAALFKRLNAEVINRHACKMYSMFESEFGIRITQVVEQIKAVAANGEAPKLLKLSPGAPLLCIERLAYTFGDKPVEWRKSLCNTKEHYYMNTIV
ncbi:MAG TPA: GntR family transcriptional regulator [Burkholderiales bacterium]|nr:GntR family transcriptional regulator [Burkholderiales bacterium]